MSEVVELGAGARYALGAVYPCRRYVILFYTLLFTLIASPLVAVFELHGALIEFFLAANLLAAVLPVHARRVRRLLLAAVAVAWLARPATVWFDHPALSMITLAIWTVIGFIAAATALRFAMGASQIDSEHLYAALSAYLLAGIFLGLCYWVIEQLVPLSFAAPGDFTRVSALYFSFVTLATLGYGDVVPRTDLARGLAIVEAVGGQLFLAVMVARLVSLYGGAQPKKS
jgi:Ion channel